MDFEFSAEDRALIERARELAGEFATRAQQYDDDSSFPEEDFASVREAGFHTLAIPRDNGGFGMWRDQRYSIFYRLLEILASGNASTAQLVQIQSHATGIIGYLGNDEQKRRILGDVVENGKLIASCGSETDPRQFASSDGRSEMELVDGGFRLNAVKHFGSLVPAADYYLVYVMAPGAESAGQGLTTAVIPKEADGVSIQDNWDVMGMRATVSWALKLENVFIPWENVLGQPGDWVQHDPRTFTPAYAANHLGTAQGVFDFLLEYINQRPFLANDDVNVFMLGEMASALQATRTSLMHATRLWERGDFAAAELASMRALHTSKQAALMVTSKAFDICGARAAFRHLPVERAFRDVRTFSLHFRESQLLRLLAEAELGGEFHSKQKYGPKLGRQSWNALGIERPVGIS